MPSVQDEKAPWTMPRPLRLGRGFLFLGTIVYLGAIALLLFWSMEDREKGPNVGVTGFLLILPPLIAFFFHSQAFRFCAGVVALLFALASIIWGLGLDDGGVGPLRLRGLAVFLLWSFLAYLYLADENVRNFVAFAAEKRHLRREKQKAETARVARAALESESDLSKPTAGD